MINNEISRLDEALFPDPKREIFCLVPLKGGEK
jgi:hypothetical protein